MVEGGVPRRKHLVGLDTLRFAAAAWVAASHGMRLPVDQMISTEHFVGKLLVALNNGLFNGNAAVLLFFVISGFVIHLPNVGRNSIDLRSFYARRLTRIVPPTLIAFAICWAAGPVYLDRFGNILWSLYCEIAYYLIYPALFLLFRRGLTVATFLVTTLVALAIIAASWPTQYYWEFSLPTLIVVGLPNWILGCVLAEATARARGVRVDPGASIWLWRFGAVALSAALKVPVTHGPIEIGYPASLWLFAIYCYFWVGRELDYFDTRPSRNILEICGSASFSLYLVHYPVIGYFESEWVSGLAFNDTVAANLLAWAAQLCAIAVATYAFYMLVEAPFHRLARKLGTRGPRSAAAEEAQPSG